MDTADWDLELPFARENPVPYMHMISTSSGAKPVQCRLPADNEIAVVDWVNFTIGIETVGIAS
jgi:phage replication initiation protein